jgi:hypothetical protein
MKVFRLRGFDEARIWYNESPIGASAPDQLASTELQLTRQSRFLDATEVVLELKQPRGPVCLYGLLGARFKPANDTKLRLDVRYGSEPYVFADSLLSAIEVARCGLPQWAAQEVLFQFESSMKAHNSFSAGHIDVCYAAAGEASSNMHMFKILARALPVLMSMRPSNPDEICALLYP